jgi:ABC-2 type transport system permease protein
VIADIWTVMWKEWKELFHQRGPMRGGAVGLLFFVAMFGVFLPLQMGRAWVETPVALIYWAWVPVFLVTNVIADSFAGERERHTLEALLASRLSDRAILFGKLGAAVGYALGLTWVSLLLGLVTVNLRYARATPLLFAPTVSLAIVVVSLLAAVLASAVGVLVSLRASTVRQAQQSLSIAIMLLLFVPIFGIQALPDDLKSRAARALLAADLRRVAVTAMAVLVLLDAALLTTAMARFQRARLILE